jgi:hypothetical protein
MIKPSIFNAINFSPDFNRESKFFDASLQRKKSIISQPYPYCYMAFKFEPATMPASIPDAVLKFYYNDGANHVTFYNLPLGNVELPNGYIYRFNIYQGTILTGRSWLELTIDDYTDILFSEELEFIAPSELASENVVQVTAYNNDNTHGYVDASFPACGYFRVSEFNNKVFGVEKVEYSYSYGRKKILNAENYIKTRITFLDLSMYQQNLLKTLCNCENLTINGISYYLVSDFTEVDKNEENEICSLRAEFIEIADTTFFGIGATEMPTDLDIKNLFTI